MKIKSKRERRAAGRLIFFWAEIDLLYLPNSGLAAANIDTLALRLVVMPAFAIEMVCCSMTS